MQNVTPSQLRLRDVVRLSSTGHFNDSVVRQVTADEVVLFRPYATTADFEYTGGVIPYIGIEEVRLSLKDTRTLELLHRPEAAR